MARRQILSLSERESLLALPDDELTLTRMAYFSEQDLAFINAHRKPASRFGFAVLLCYLKNIGFAPDKKSSPSAGFSTLRKYSSRLLSALQLRATPAALPLNDALDTIREMYRKQLRKVPSSAPLDFIPESWKKMVITPQVLTGNTMKFAQ